MTSIKNQKKEEALDLIQLLEDAMSDLEDSSVENDDICDVQLLMLAKVILEFKKQL